MWHSRCNGFNTKRSGLEGNFPRSLIGTTAAPTETAIDAVCSDGASTPPANCQRPRCIRSDYRQPPLPTNDKPRRESVEHVHA